LGLDETLDKLNATLDKLLGKSRSQPKQTILTQAEIAVWKLTEPSYAKPIAHPTKLTRKNSDEDLTEPGMSGVIAKYSASPD